MVLLTRNTCRERSPAFHPAYEPRADLKLELLRRGSGGVAACNVEVAEWDDLPPLKQCEEELLIAEEHSGLCRRCCVEIQAERQRHGPDVVVVAKFGGRNHMDPVWNFPHRELASLFQCASLTVSMVVALKHMQVSFHDRPAHGRGRREKLEHVSRN